MFSPKRRFLCITGNFATMTATSDAKASMNEMPFSSTTKEPIRKLDITS